MYVRKYRWFLVFCMLLGVRNADASNSASSTTLLSIKILFHGILAGKSPSAVDGNHNFRIRVFGKDGELIHEESQDAEVRASSYDLLLGSNSPLSSHLNEEYEIHVSVDGGRDVVTHGQLSMYTLISDASLGSALEARENRIYVPLDQEAISAQMSESIAMQRGLLHDPVYPHMPLFLPYMSPLQGLSLEMSLAPPARNTPTDAYQMAKYGRLAIEYNNFARIDGNRFGLAAQALHVAHHLLLYSAGLTSDINNDGMFLITTGMAHYQTGNSRLEPFVDAPFMRFKFRSSEEDIFMYSELETTMHFREYVSGMVGLGFRLGPGLRMIGGYHHTEFVMPSEQIIRQVDGLQGIMSWGM